MNKNITLLTDYLGFLRRDNYQCSSLNLEKIKEILVSNNFNCNIISFKEIGSGDANIKNSFIWYSSTEFPSYKNYIEDILLSLDKSNILIPNFDFFRAHNNKGYQALIRKRYGIPLLNYIYLGTVEELESIDDKVKFPVVLKAIKGSSGKNVELINNKTQLIKTIKSRTHNKDYLLNLGKKFLKRYVFKGKYDYENSLESLHYYNFILQQFIPNLKNDWKVLIFFDKFYIIKRDTRKNDFRASGSGNFYYGEFNEKVLDFCLNIRKKFNVPWLSLDVGFDGEQCYLFEYQMMHFGPIALKNSNCYFKKNQEGWEKVEKKSDLSVEYAKAFVKYIANNYE